jgi:ribosomal protein S18 acetylase RimI-like enzyme
MVVHAPILAASTPLPAGFLGARISLMAGAISYRRAGVDDVDALVDIQHRSPSKEAVTMAGSAGAARRFQALLLTKGLADGSDEVIVLEVDGAPGGFAQLSTGGDVPPLGVVARSAVKAMGLAGALRAGWRSLARAAVDLKPVEDGIHLVELQVDPDRRNHGLGGLLLAEVERIAIERRAPSISLTTQIDNPARRLYERTGFHVEAEKRHRRYEAITGSPGRVLMVKQLTA